MSGKLMLLYVCGVLAISAARAQCGNSGLGVLSGAGLGLGSGSYGLSSGIVTGGLLGGAGLGLGSGSCGLTSGVIGNGLVGGAGLGYGSQGYDALDIVTGSSYAPNGINVVADNLEISGPLAVSGAYPILGTVSFGGNLPTGGQGQVSYSTASGVALGSGGCGYGLGSAQPNIGLSGVSGVNNLIGSSQLGISNSGCGCGRNYY